jgi:transcriptional regulator with XRE-family HTH domain
MPMTYVPRPIEIATRAVSSAVVLAPLYLVLAGTAGMYSPQAVARLADFSPTPIIQVVGKKTQKRYWSTSERLLKVRDIFGLKMSELAEIFGVSRTAAYDWLNGSTPKADIAVKIEMLASYADAVQEMEGNRTSLSRRNPLLSGRTLVNAVKTGQNLEETISILREGRIQESPSFAPKRGSQRLREESSSFLSEIVTPIIIEQT